MEKQIPGQKFTVSHDSPLLKYLYEIFPEQSKTGVKAYLTNGQVVLNGHKATAFDMPLHEGDTLIILPKKVSLYNEVRHAARVSLQEHGVEVLYEDDAIIVVNKKSGLPVVGTGKSAGRAVNIDKKGSKASLNSQRKEVTVYSILCDYIRTKNHADRMSASERLPWRPNNVFVVHRLDRDTSGILVFAKTEQIQQILQDGWNNNVRTRGYIGILEGTPTPAQGVIKSWLKENPKSMKMISSKNPDFNDRKPAGKPVKSTEEWQEAITRYNTIQSGILLRGRKTSGAVNEALTYSIVEFDLETGRKNQIRVHAASELHCPIAGDKKYGAETSPIGRLALHAGTLVFRHPVTGKYMTFTAKPPKEFGI